MLGSITELCTCGRLKFVRKKMMDIAVRCSRAPISACAGRCPPQAQGDMSIAPSFDDDVQSFSQHGSESEAVCHSCPESKVECHPGPGHFEMPFKWPAEARDSCKSLAIKRGLPDHLSTSMAKNIWVATTYSGALTLEHVLHRICANLAQEKLAQGSFLNSTLNF